MHRLCANLTICRQRGVWQSLPTIPSSPLVLSWIRVRLLNFTTLKIQTQGYTYITAIDVCYEIDCSAQSSEQRR